MKMALMTYDIVAFDWLLFLLCIWDELVSNSPRDISFLNIYRGFAEYWEVFRYLNLGHDFSLSNPNLFIIDNCPFT